MVSLLLVLFFVPFSLFSFFLFSYFLFFFFFVSFLLLFSIEGSRFQVDDDDTGILEIINIAANHPAAPPNRGLSFSRCRDAMSGDL